LEFGPDMSPGDWVFDDDVAKRFDQEARTHIPHYEEVIEKCVVVAKTLPSSARIIDIGSATGYTLEKLRAAGFTDVWGVDNSRAMLNHSRVSENLLESGVLPREHGPFDLILANWTLHFIENREEYMRDMRDSLSPSALLILSDKMSCSELVHSQYHDFKRSQGVSEEEIAAKAASIVGILSTRPLSWYLETLEKLGFDTEVIDASWCFATILCRMRA